MHENIKNNNRYPRDKIPSSLSEINSDIPEGDKSSTISDKLNNLISKGNDTDRLFIGAVLYLLLKENCDKKLIIALLYIML